MCHELMSNHMIVVDDALIPRSEIRLLSCLLVTVSNGFEWEQVLLMSLRQRQQPIQFRQHLHSLRFTPKNKRRLSKKYVMCSQMDENRY